MDFIVRTGESVQSAIDAAHANGGGRVVIEPGIHSSRTIHMKSFVELHLPAGAKIQGGSTPGDYDDFFDPGFDAVAPEGSRKCLVAAAHAENIAITGAGEINCSGPQFYDRNVPSDAYFAKPPHPRPRMIQFYDCRNVRFEGVSFVDSPGWTFWLIDCENVNVSRIVLTGCQQMINNDGLHIDGCRRVTVSDCYIRTGDDCLVLRAIRKGAERQHICEGVVVTNCILDSWSQAIRIGCPSDDTVRNCTLSNIVIQGRGNGININNPRRYLRKGCNGYLDLHDIVFSNIVIESGHVPIWINVEEGVNLRRIAGITFSNIRANSGMPCKIEGSSETIIEDIRFSEMKCRQPMVLSKCRRISLNQVEIDNV